MIDVHLAPDAALIHLPSGVVGVRTPQQAHEIADAFRRAGNHLEEMERAEGDRKDRAVGRLVNAALRVVNVTTPGTLTPTSTVVRQHIAGDGPCACSCAAVCGCEPSTPGDAA